MAASDGLFVGARIAVLDFEGRLVNIYGVDQLTKDKVVDTFGGVWDRRKRKAIQVKEGFIFRPATKTDTAEWLRRSLVTGLAMWCAQERHKGQTMAALRRAANELGMPLPSARQYQARRVRCQFCKKLVPAKTAHRHQSAWVGDACCWDERLRAG